MGAAYYIVLERKVDGLDTGMDGKSLSQHIEALDQAARGLGVRPLSEFFSIAPEEAADFMEGEGMDASDIKLPPLQQFTAEDGLATVRALAAHPAARGDGVARDLRECERILTVAAQQGIGWHFEVDF
jgi:GNAT superfamily N-acetyltransferase